MRPTGRVFFIRNVIYKSIGYEGRLRYRHSFFHTAHTDVVTTDRIPTDVGA